MAARACLPPRNYWGQEATEAAEVVEVVAVEGAEEAEEARRDVAAVKNVVVAAVLELEQDLGAAMLVEQCHQRKSSHWMQS